jgi:hypothetical protein
VVRTTSSRPEAHNKGVRSDDPTPLGESAPRDVILTGVDERLISVRVEGWPAEPDSGCAFDVATAEWLSTLELPEMFRNELAEAQAAVASGDEGYLLEIAYQEVDSLRRAVERARLEDSAVPAGVTELERALRYED